VNLITFKI